MMLTTSWFMACRSMLLAIIILLYLFNPLRCTLLVILDLLNTTSTSDGVALIRQGRAIRATAATVMLVTPLVMGWITSYKHNSHLRCCSLLSLRWLLFFAFLYLLWLPVVLDFNHESLGVIILSTALLKDAHCTDSFYKE